MTRVECESIVPGMRCVIGDEFVEDPYEGLEKYFGTTQIVEKVDLGGTGWIYFEGIHQPFAISEVDRIQYEIETIDDANVPYDRGDISLILWEVLL